MRKRFAERLSKLRNFAYFMMWAGSHITSLDDSKAPEFFRSVEPSIRRALRRAKWTEGKKKITISAENLAGARPHLTRLVSEMLIVQLDALVHQTLNDVQSRPGQDEWFEQDIKVVLGLSDEAESKDAQASLWLVKNSERYRDLVLLALVGNSLLHAGEQAPALESTRSRNLESRLRCLGKLLSRNAQANTPLTWTDFASKKQKVGSPEEIVEWCQKEVAAICDNLAYDDFFRFTWAAKTVLNEVIRAHNKPKVDTEPLTLVKKSSVQDRPIKSPKMKGRGRSNCS